jgi:carnitine-CoA ligase
VRSHAKILEVAVIPVLDEPRRGGQCLPDELTPAEIVEACRTQLAEYKVPRYVEVRKSEFERPT